MNKRIETLRGTFKMNKTLMCSTESFNSSKNSLGIITKITTPLATAIAYSLHLEAEINFRGSIFNSFHTGFSPGGGVYIYRSVA